MNTTVITTDEHDFGAGRDRRVEFVDCRWKVDERGALHIYQLVNRGSASPLNVPVAAFAPDAWLTVTNGSIHGREAVSVAAVKR